MNLTDEEKVAFGNVSWAEGLKLLAERQKRVALKELITADPMNTTDIARAQAAYAIWNTDIPSIERDVNEFLASESANRQPR